MTNISNLRGYADTAREQATVLAGKLGGATTQAATQAVTQTRHSVSGLTATVTDRAGGLVTRVARDERVSGLVGAAGTVGQTIVQTAQERVVAPVRTLAGRGPAEPA